MSVIKEVPIFLSKQCMENLLLFEFPNRPKENPIKESLVADCRYKPKYNHAELWLSLDTGSANYERHRGLELGRLAPEQFGRAGGLYDRQLLRSQPAGQARRPPQQERRRLAVARFHGDRLVLCPMPAGAASLVMEPALDHLDVKLATDASASAGPADAASAEAVPDAKAVTLRFARQETPEARQRREQSHRACQRLLDQEPWLRCRWRARGSGEEAAGVSVAMETEKEAAEADEQLGEEAPGGGGGYLDRLCPAVSGGASAGDASAMATSVTAAAVADQAPSVSLARLRAMPCAERLRALFKSACVLRWSQLVDLLKQCGMTHGQLTESLTQIHGHLTELACLVRGLWVVKSEVLYPAGTLSMYSGVPAEVMCRGRDYILCRFAQGRAVTRKEVASLVKMPSEEISQILGRISRVVRPGSGDPGSGGHQHQMQEQKKAVKMRLVFVADDDTEYTRRNPDVVKKAQYYWDAKWKLLTEQLKLDKDKASRAFRTASISMETGWAGGRRSRTSSARYSVSSQSDCGGDAASDSSLSSTATDGRRRQARHRQPQQPQVKGGGDSSGRSQARAARRSVSLCEDAAAFPAAAAAAAAAAASAEVRSFLQAKLQDRMVASQDELVRIYRVEAAAGAPLEEAGLRRQLDLAAESLGFVVLPGGGGSGAGRIYAFVSDSLPHAGHRRELLAALKAGAGAPQVTLGQLRERFELAGLVPMSEGALKSLIKEYCTFKGKAYYAKGFMHAT